MRVVSKSPKALLLLALLAVPATGGWAQEQQDQSEGDVMATVYGQGMPDPATMAKGPQIDGIISARSGDQIQITTADGNRTAVAVGDMTKIRAKGGFLGLDRDKLAADSLMNGLPVSVETLQWDGGLLASQIDLKNKDLKTASMIHTGTNQRFEAQEAATEALRGRMGDIDKYNIKGTTNVNFAVGKANLSEQAKADLCAAASQAEATDNALLLVVGYTDSTGSQEFNQQLSEKRASRVVNYLQQACGWKPYRMLTPTGMAEADPLADNETPEGKAQNRRVAVNILVSKSVDGM
ncbi:OmpA family protein [Sphingopyxis indica]|uniref:OmpA family protein n=1 Tax=Sphingopyxis indica TaxID=436663 RepID=UPI002938DB0C|nr:OmpA family protein [Sphingopyxis indica]WOF43176.1 OmpA family protein [Sphingopyxis indica]